MKRIEEHRRKERRIDGLGLKCPPRPMQRPACGTCETGGGGDGNFERKWVTGHVFLMGILEPDRPLYVSLVSIVLHTVR